VYGGRSRQQENEMASKQKTLIVTGASQGIGAGVVQSFLDRGYNVVANSRNISKSGAFKASDKLALVDGNIGDSAVAAKIVETAVTKFGSIDGVVNNAGIFFAKPFTEYTAEDFKALSSVNLEGFLYVTQGAVKQMLSQKSGGSVVTITTSLVVNPIAGVTSSVPMITKGGLEAVTRVWQASMRRRTSASTQSRPAWWIHRCTQLIRRTSSRLFRRWVQFRAWRTSWTLWGISRKLAM
jgi:NAD(P)-dependent dehydrogenase (short-subunit alcohol dehydrogenase family)